MPDTGSAKLGRSAIRLVAAGVGGVAAGPLGISVGAMIGGLFTEQAGEFIEEYVSAGGHAISEFCIHCFHHGFREVTEDRPLESVVRTALGTALDDLDRGLNPEVRQTYGDWFHNWKLRLKDSASSPKVGEQLSPRFADDEVTREQALNDLFRCTMERLDGEIRTQRAADSGDALSITGKTSFREMPVELLLLITDRLPVLLRARFDEYLAIPENGKAWIAVQQSFHSYAVVQLRAIRNDTRRILDVLDKQLVPALEEHRTRLDVELNDRKQREKSIIIPTEEHISKHGGDRYQQILRNAARASLTQKEYVRSKRFISKSKEEHLSD